MALCLCVFVSLCLCVFVLSSLRVFVSSCLRVFVSSCLRVFVLSYFRTFVLSYFRISVLSSLRAFVFRVSQRPRLFVSLSLRVFAHVALCVFVCVLVSITVSFAPAYLPYFACGITIIAPFDFVRILLRVYESSFPIVVFRVLISFRIPYQYLLTLESPVHNTYYPKHLFSRTIKKHISCSSSSPATSFPLYSRITSYPNVSASPFYLPGHFTYALSH